MSELSISVNALQRKINKLLEAVLESSPIYPALPNQISFKNSGNKILDLVLMGDVLSVLTSLRFGKIKPLVRLWCLSEKHAQLVSQTFHIPLTHIGIIPRYSLFKPNDEPRKFPAPSQKITIVIASRWTIHKKNELSLLLANSIRGLWPSMVSIVHAFPSNRELKLAKKFINDQGLENIDLIKKGFHWTEYIETNYENVVYLNLSQDICEDFGVSLAQVEAMGWPSIISAWGGHLDANKSWRILLSEIDSNPQEVKKILSKFLRYAEPPNEMAEEDFVLKVPELILFEEDLFHLKKETILELLFSKQRLVSQFDSQIRSILKK